MPEPLQDLVLDVEYHRNPVNSDAGPSEMRSDVCVEIEPRMLPIQPTVTEKLILFPRISLLRSEILTMSGFGAAWVTALKGSGS